MDRQRMNKELVQRFNYEFLARGDEDILEALLHPQFINHTAPAGLDVGKEGMRFFIKSVLHQAFSDLSIEIYRQVAEADLVTTYKAFHGKHTGVFMNLPPTGKTFLFRVMDIYRIEDNQLIEHWGIRDTQGLLAQLTN